MIDREKIRHLLRSDEPWGDISEPAGFGFQLTEVRKHRGIIRGPLQPFAWGLSAAAAAACVAILAGLLLPRGVIREIRQPFNGEKKVEIVGTVNGWKGRIPMKLDTTGTFWVASVRLPGKGVYEYQIVIDGLIYTAGESEYRIMDPDGSERALLIVRNGRAGPEHRKGG